jgi:hypothetical protein
MILLAFGLLLASFLIAVFQFWRIHRRTRIREKALAFRMMEETWSRKDDEEAR